MKNHFIFITIFLGTLYSQCDSYTSSECDTNSNCEWVEEIEYGYCGNHNSAASCPNYPVCSWSCQGGWYLGECVGSYACTGGSYEFDNGSCNEILMPECSEMNESVCNSNGSCSWVESFSYGYCNNISWQQCENYSGCYVDSNPGWYDNSGPYCTGGTYQIDSSYCEEVEVLDCSGLNHGPCMSNSECEWVEDIETGNCSDINNGSECYATNQCSWYNAGSYGYWYDNCYGGTYTYDDSYCAEITFQLGDINGDSSINILDIIEMVNLILENEYNQVVDMNSDNSVNVLDIVIIVEIILGN